MQAIIEDRGRQYLVRNGQTLLVDLLAEAEPGSRHVFERVLSLGETVGEPCVAGARVTATVVEHVQAPKLHVMKFKRRKDYRRRVGHRQRYTKITISGIDG